MRAHPQGHIVDKGRAKTETQANYGVFNPITCVAAANSCGSCGVAHPTSEPCRAHTHVP